jgi:hypothetical protein
MIESKSIVNDLAHDLNIMPLLKQLKMHVHRAKTSHVLRNELGRELPHLGIASTVF